ncbi:hypothetical protein [Roseovarius aquimarinus]|uniref:Uncharacterized protein n=1 Tax=Roseovarius aquimarinus TaxID=1229156 RepID=A0ABW7I6Q9_9RHOB
MAKTTSSELALQRLNSRGMTLRRFIISDGEEHSEFTNEILAGARPDPDKGHTAIFAHDVEKAAIELASEIASEPLSFDAAILLVSKQIRLNRPIPDVLREWAADALEGRIKRPKGRGKHQGATKFRDRLIARLIRDVVDMTNLAASSNAREDGSSACNAVAEGFRLLRLQPDSYESMIKIWRRRHDLLEVSFPERV